MTSPKNRALLVIAAFAVILVGLFEAGMAFGRRDIMPAARAAILLVAGAVVIAGALKGWASQKP